MLERHVKNPQGGSLISGGDRDNNGESSSEMTAGTSSSKENLQCSEHIKLPNVQVGDTDDDDDEAENNSDAYDEIDTSKRRSVLDMANAIEASLTISINEASKQPPTTSDDADNSVSTPPTPSTPSQPQSQFWSLQAGITTGRSSMASSLSKIKRPSQHPKTSTPPAQPPAIKTPVPEPIETTVSPEALLLDPHAVSPVTSPAAIICSGPSPTYSKSSTRTVITRETLEGSGPRVRLTRSEILRQKAKEKQQKQNHKREEMTLKPRTNGFVNKQLRANRPKDYPKPWLVPDSKKQTISVRTSRTSRPKEPRVSTGKEPQINKLTGRRSRSRPAATTNQTGKVRLTRAAILKLRQQQEKAATQMTLQDMDNQRLGIPPVKFLEIPNSPTKINFEDDDMEHPNDTARRKLRQLFEDNSKSTKAR